jgi:hypothetical protein
MYVISGVNVNFSSKLALKCRLGMHHGLRSRISCLNITPLFALFVFLLLRLTSGAFTIGSSTPTLTRHSHQYPIYLFFEMKTIVTTKNGRNNTFSIYGTASCTSRFTITPDITYIHSVEKKSSKS